MFSLSSVVFMLMCTSSFSQAYRPLRGRKRILGERVVSTACSKIRNEPYKARLDLLFLYVLEYRTESEIDLLALNSAIANYLISVLNDCDANGQPKFATEIDPGSHTLITTQDGPCKRSGSSEVQCADIRGRVSVYLDGNAGAAKLRSYSTIQSLLNNTSLLAQMSGVALVDSVFVRPIGENLVVFVDDARDKRESMKSDSAGIVIAATMVSLVLTSIFLYGMYRRHQDVRDKNLPSVKQTLAYLYNKRRRFFETLADDEDFEPGWMTTSDGPTYEPCPPPSITWSVSDLTSDSHSIRSTLQLDRIVEESHSDDESREGFEPPSHIYRQFDPSELDFVAQWNVSSSSVSASNGDSSKSNDTKYSFEYDAAITCFHSNRIEDTDVFPLRGCQFLPDVSLDERSDASLPLRTQSDPPAGNSSPDCSSTCNSKDFDTPTVQTDEVEVSQSTDAVESEKNTTPHLVILASDLSLLLWWTKLLIHLQRGRVEPRLKSG